MARDSITTKIRIYFLSSKFEKSTQKTVKLQISSDACSYIIRVPLWAPHEILINSTADFEATDEHLPALAVISILFLQRDRDLFEKIYKIT